MRIEGSVWTISISVIVEKWWVFGLCISFWLFYTKKSNSKYHSIHSINNRVPHLILQWNRKFSCINCDFHSYTDLFTVQYCQCINVFSRSVQLSNLHKITDFHTVCSCKGYSVHCIEYRAIHSTSQCGRVVLLFFWQFVICALCDFYMVKLVYLQCDIVKGWGTRPGHINQLLNYKFC